jgi:hypothetical protein
MEQIDKLRAERRLDAGKSTMEKLEWTLETVAAGQELKDVCLTQPLSSYQRIGN